MKAAPSYVPAATMHLQGKWQGFSQASPRKTKIDTGTVYLRFIGLF